MQNQFIIAQKLIRLMPQENGMDRFSELNAFIAVVEAGGFSAAARRRGEGQPGISKASPRSRSVWASPCSFGARAT
jgi:hypothetical protein